MRSFALLRMTLVFICKDSTDNLLDKAGRVFVVVLMLDMDIHRSHQTIYAT